MFSPVSLFVLLSAFAVVNASLYDLFDDWARSFSVIFYDEEHRDSVFVKWVDNHLHIRRVNALNLTYTLAHNQFSGMDSEDFSNYISRPYYTLPNNKYYVNSLRTNVPLSFDWVVAGAVSPVKDQGQCGSCWSFSTTGSMEGAYFIKTGRLVSFSEQQLVDCDTFLNGGKDHGCNGGLMDNAFNWVSKNNGLCTEQDYPYVSGETMEQGTCQRTCKVVDGSSISTFVDVPPNSDDMMINALAQQPVSVAIEADQRDFQLYSSGVFTGTCGTKLDHGVLAVGYGSMNGVDYYRVKNSWSTSWGDNGYIYLARGKSYNNGAGQCGILMQASYPLM
jgi:C1A family cysteine protease